MCQNRPIWGAEKSKQPRLHDKEGTGDNDAAFIVVVVQRDSADRRKPRRTRVLEFLQKALAA